jgi:hypothetical protein
MIHIRFIIGPAFFFFDSHRGRIINKFAFYHFAGNICNFYRRIVYFIKPFEQMDATI